MSNLFGTIRRYLYMNPKPMDITRKEHHQTTETDAEAGSGVADGSTRQ